MSSPSSIGAASSARARRVAAGEHEVVRPRLGVARAGGVAGRAARRGVGDDAVRDAVLDQRAPAARGTPSAS